MTVDQYLKMLDDKKKIIERSDISSISFGPEHNVMADKIGVSLKEIDEEDMLQLPEDLVNADTSLYANHRTANKRHRRINPRERR